MEKLPITNISDQFLRKLDDHGLNYKRLPRLMQTVWIRVGLQPEDRIYHVCKILQTDISKNIPSAEGLKQHIYDFEKISANKEILGFLKGGECVVYEEHPDVTLILTYYFDSDSDPYASL